MSDFGSDELKVLNHATLLGIEGSRKSRKVEAFHLLSIELFKSLFVIYLI